MPAVSIAIKRCERIIQIAMIALQQDPGIIARMKSTNLVSSTDLLTKTDASKTKNSVAAQAAARPIAPLSSPA